MSTKNSNKIAFLFIYSKECITSKKILEEITSKNLYITPMKIKNDEMKCWLKNNEHGVVVKEVPCFLVKLPGAKTVVYPSKEYKRVFTAIADLQKQTKS